MSDEEKRICLGAIVGVHGIKGEVKVKSFTEYAEDIDQYGDLEDEAGSRKFKLKVIGLSKDLLRVKIQGVDDRDVAMALRGTGLYVDKDLLPELEEEEFYHTDLIGLEARNQDGLFIGEVVGVYNFGAGDMLDIKTSETGKSEMLPFTKEYVPTVSIKDGFIIVSSLLAFAEDEEEELSGEEHEG